MLETAEKPRLRLLLDHFALIEDDREGWRVAHPLPEVLLLVVCGTIASGDDFEDIADWGEDNLAFLRRFLPYHHGVPGARWLRMLMNRIDPGLFADCFRSWAAALRPEAPDLVAIDGKTSRGSHDRDRGRAALHLVSAFATRERLVIGQEAVAQGSCEQDTIPLLLERLSAAKVPDGALVTIDAIACNPKVARAVVDAGADYLIAVKANQPGLFAEIERFFDDPQSPPPDRAADIDKGHGRVEQRSIAVSTHVDWMKGQRRFPGEYRLPDIAAIVMVETETFQKRKTSRSRRFYVSSRAMTAAEAANAIRAHWAIETSLHWVLDVTFGEDKARGRTGHGPANMAVVCATSHSTSSAWSTTGAQSSCAENALQETANTSNRSSSPYRVNPDSLPWLPHTAGAPVSHIGNLVRRYSRCSTLCASKGCPTARSPDGSAMNVAA